MHPDNCTLTPDEPEDKRTAIEKIADDMKAKSASRLGGFYALQDRTRPCKLINARRPGAPDPNSHLHKFGLKICKRNPKRCTNYPTGVDKLNAKGKAIVGLLKLYRRVDATPEQIKEWDTPVVTIEPLPKDSSTESGSN
jgi:hypothetical protein